GPIPNGPMTEKSDIRIGYDDQFLYVSGQFFDSEPEEIRTNSLYRDRYSGDDVFGIVLDTFNDNETALWFSTTPAGIRIDRSVANDAEFTGGGFESVMNDSWNTYWEVAAIQNGKGWFTEMRIPYSSLGFQVVDGRVEMGLIAYRFIVRNSERHIFPAIPPDWGLGFAKPSQARTVILENVESSKPMYITPYLTGGVGQVSELNDQESSYERVDNYQRDVGLDFKFPLTNNLTFDATINTDFSQVEADNQQVNLTRFSLFFPEKRQFFQERSGIFSFSTDLFDRVFYSRRIGLSDDGVVRILGGARLVGRIGGWDIGLLNMQTESSPSSPTENFGVLRLRKQVFNEQSYAGTIITSRVGDDGSYNLVYGLDGAFKVSEREYLSTKWIQTFEDKPFASSKFDFAESAFAQVRLERRGNLGFGFISMLSYSGQDYNPGIGFVQRRGYTSGVGELRYGWFASESSTLREIRLAVDVRSFFRNMDGSLESLSASHSWKLNTKSGGEITPRVRFRVEDLNEELSFPGNVDVPVGRYSFVTAAVSFSLPEGGIGPIRTGRQGNQISYGSFYDGSQFDVMISPVWSPSKHLEFTVPYRYSRLRFTDRNQSVDVHLVGLNTQIGFTTRVSINSFVQYNTAEKLVNGNVRFRYNIREGNDFWLVFNQNMNTDRMREELALPVIESRTVLLKYTHTFIQ
ncbi:MAG: DUF5916 domain-containing protein, partial [Bacteroidetes bacterium]|nr:DUF5916 domain-containing protein [Bacteroidota bacterium]